ncbi:MAG TPA: glycosyltransferase [Chloroflexota bacterium]|nr:glycosyltransferase [Chloroflexota bacterium]
MARRKGEAARVLFAIGSWGLGHATRDLPLIRGLLNAGQQVTVLASGASLRLLQSELGAGCEFIDFPGMRIPIGRSPFWFYFKYTVTLPVIWWDTFRQHVDLEGLLAANRFDVLISDNRYAAWSRRLPSYLIAHGLRFIAPGRRRVLELGLERFNAQAFSPYRRILVPDFERDDLSGELSHGLRFYPPDQVRYLGLLSSVGKLDVERKQDVFISISGPEPQRTILERTILRQLASTPARGLVALGRPGMEHRGQANGWQIAGYLDRREQAEAMNGCRFAVIRAGYSTIMELAELGTPAVLIPTPGQTEQEYITGYHAALGHYFAASQDGLDLANAIAAGPPPQPYRPPHLTSTSVQRFLEEVLG